MVVALAVALSAPSSARGADLCRVATCGRLTVPLDHSGETPGTLSLAFAYVPALRTRRGTIVVLMGGPGEAAIPWTVFYRRLLRPLRGGYDLVLLDQRGAGRSSPLVGPPISRLADITACGERLGARRRFFTTAEIARD